jgi:hypothetical protein
MESTMKKALLAGVALVLGGAGAAAAADFLPPIVEAPYMKRLSLIRSQPQAAGICAVTPVIQLEQD